MNRDDILRMVRDIGAAEPGSLYGRTDYMVMTVSELERFAALVAAAEREACADICDQHASIEGVAQRCAEQIRGRNMT